MDSKMHNELLQKFRSQIEELRSESSTEFAHLGQEIYLDHAANALYMSSLINDFNQKLTAPTSASNWSLFTNPHSHSQSAHYTQLCINLTREKCLEKLFNTSSSEYELIFVANATQALKMLAENFSFELKCSSESQMHSHQNGPCLLYLHDNHTSVIGMREIVWEKHSNVNIYCATEIGQQEFSTSLIKRPEKYATRARLNDQPKSFSSNNLIIYPLQSNFNGRIYDFSLKEKLIENFESKQNWFLCADTASYLSTSPLDLSLMKPDFLVLSFYKMFGFPTGLGALLVRKTRRHFDLLNAKAYFGGGNIQLALINDAYAKLKNENLYEIYEEGTQSYLDIIAVSLAIDKFAKLTFNQGFRLINLYVSFLSEYFQSESINLKHYNGVSLIELYRLKDNLNYGPIFAFNLKSSKQKYISFSLVDKLAQANRIHLRVGCFCNLGACQLNLKHLSNKKLVENLHIYKHKCGDHIDLIDSLPTGSIRVSLGYCSTINDLDYFLQFLRDNFLETKDENAIFDSSIQNRNRSAKVQYFKIEHLLIYPIKSCAPIKIEHSWPLNESENGGGFLYDRNWLIIDSNRVPLSQKRHGRFLTKLGSEILLDKNLMILKFDGEKFSLDLCARNIELKQVLLVGHGNKTMKCVDEGDLVSAWLTKMFQLDSACRLLRIVESKNDSSEEKLSSFNNKADLLLINESSIRKLRSHLDKNNNNNSLSNRSNSIDYFLALQFRPNIIVSVLNEEHESTRDFDEEIWSSSLKILNKSIEFKMLDKCTRCQMINIDQNSIEPNEEWRRETFARYCANLLKELYKLKSNSNFGIYLTNFESVRSGNESETNGLWFVEKKMNEINRKKLSIGDVGVVELCKMKTV